MSTPITRPGTVHQWAAGIAGLHVGVDLDQTIEPLAVAATFVCGDDVLIKRDHRSPGCTGGTSDAARIANGDDRLADSDIR